MIGERILDAVSKSLGGTAPAVPTLALAGVGSRRSTSRSARAYLESYGGDDAIEMVRACVDMYAQTTSNADYFFCEERPPGAGQHSKPKPVEKPPQDLVNLFRNPNPYQDWTELIELGVIDLLVAGEFFWLKYKVGTNPNDGQLGKPLGLYRLEPQYVEIEFDEHGRPAEVVYNAPNKHGEPGRFKPKDIVHVKLPNPHDPWRGLSVIAGSPRLYDVQLALEEAMATYYENGTRPSGVLESDRTVPKTTWDKIKLQFRQLYQGPEAAGSVVMLEKGLKFNRMSADANDAEFEKMTNLLVNLIAKAFKIPLPLLGETASNSDRQAVKEAQRIFDNKVMRPFLNRLQEQITRQLVAAWGLELYIDYEYVMPIEDKLDLAEALAGLPGVTVLEVRKQVDLAPLEETDEVSAGSEIDEMVLNLPGEDRADGGFPDNTPNGDKGGRPANPENTRAFRNDGSIPDGAAVRKSLATEDSVREIRKSLRVARERLKEVK